MYEKLNFILIFLRGAEKTARGPVRMEKYVSAMAYAPLGARGPGKGIRMYFLRRFVFNHAVDVRSI